MKKISTEEIEGFDWDEANTQKNWPKHRVTDIECEEIFFSRPLFWAVDKEHSIQEKRYLALGTTFQGRRLSVAFTKRGDHIRIISARDMTLKETRIFGNYVKEENTEV